MTTSGSRLSGYKRVEHDWYVEPSWTVEALLAVEKFTGSILDPHCGGGTIPSVCLRHGLDARGSDIEDRGFGPVADVFGLTEPVDNIISNPPYGIAERCIRHHLMLARDKVAAILPMVFWGALCRDDFFANHPPIRWYPFARRPSMPPGSYTGVFDENGAIVHPKAAGGTMDYGWMVWQKGYNGPTSIPCRLS